MEPGELQDGRGGHFKERYSLLGLRRVVHQVQVRGDVDQHVD